VPVGLEPVAVATRVNAASRTEAWVVNHLSDSVSIVEVDPTDVTDSRVTRTLLVGDEPRDILFAGTGNGRAFITCAHRGQNRPGDPQLTTEGVGRADVWVFNANSLGAALGGTPVGGAPVTLFADTPRALAKSPDGSTVYAAALNSGNQTTTVLEGIVSALGGLPPPPPGSTSGAPPTGLIVKFDPMSGQWRDEVPRDWGAQIMFTLPDLDVFLLNANATPPSLAGTVAGVGSTILSMAVNPANAKLYVGNLHARNEVRFEPLLQANIAQSHITVVTGTTPLGVHLNPHIAYGGVPEDPEQSLAFPVAIEVSSDGSTVYVAALGSGKVGILDASDLEAGTITEEQIDVGVGPSGLALDEPRDRLYVMNRIDHTISVVSNLSDPMTRTETPVPLRYNPEPPAVRDGRRFLYDARNTSGNGDQACASCHIFGDFDGLAWDLGDPMGATDPNFNPFRAGGASAPFHPMKGPMTTQSLRGMADAGPMHWRGDRSGAAFAGDSTGALNEDLAFKEFNPAFVGLLGRSTQLLPAEMQAFTDFILTVRYPPNPIRQLSNAPTAAESAGEGLFTTVNTDGGLIQCDFCHRLPLGTDGLMSIEGEPQEFKIAHQRNLYQKVGMFGLPPAVAGSGLEPTGLIGDQVRGFGFLHDGGIPTVFDFVSANVFQRFDRADPVNNPAGPHVGSTDRRNLEAFLLAFDTGLRPAVGQQVTATPSTFNDANVVGRISLLIGRDDAGDCDLVVKGVIGGLARGAVYVGGNQFQLDRNTDPLIGATDLRTLAGTAGQELTYTCVPPGSGMRIGVDRDEDNLLDQSELDGGSDPTDPSDPGGVTTTTTSTSSTTSSTAVANVVRIRTNSLALKDDVTNPVNPNGRRINFRSNTKSEPPANDIVLPARGSGGDPTFAGASLTIYNASGLTTDSFQVTLNAAGWAAVGPSAAPKGYRFTSLAGGIQRVMVKNHRIVIRGGKAAFGYTLDEAAQGSVAVRLQLGNGDIWCAAGDPPKVDRAGKFQARATLAPAACP
jgi:DNA-binding beta-propeller fold protein YncE